RQVTLGMHGRVPAVVRAHHFGARGASVAALGPRKPLNRQEEQAWHIFRLSHSQGILSTLRGWRARADAVASPYDEMLDAAGTPRVHCQHYWNWLDEQPSDPLAQKRAEADALFHRVGITFAVYGENAGTERLIPFDIVPRILPADEWTRLEAG